MSQPNQPNQQGQPVPWYQDDSGKEAKPFPFGNPAAANPQQQTGTQPPAAQQPGSQPAGSQPVGSQPAAQTQPPAQQWAQPVQEQQGVGTQVSAPDHGAAPVGRILDPRTGEIHPAADLNQLQETDALLVVVSGPDAGAQILLDTDLVTVGRSPNADIFLDDVTVSRKHAEFVRTPSGFTLRDTGSLNGTYVGRQLIDSIELQNGADVQIGKFRMIFQQRPRTA